MRESDNANQKERGRGEGRDRAEHLHRRRVHLDVDVGLRRAGRTTGCVYQDGTGGRSGQCERERRGEESMCDVKNRQWSASEHKQCSVSTLYMNAKQGVSCIRKRGCKSETFIARHFLSLTPHFSALGGKGMQEISRVTWNKLLRPGERQRGKGGRNAGRGREGKRARGYCELQIVLRLPSAKEQT